jgi:hypothetical protein
MVAGGGADAGHRRDGDGDSKERPLPVRPFMKGRR